MSKENRTLLIQIILLIVTVITTTLAGAEWIFGRSFILGDDRLDMTHFYQGFAFSLPFLAVLTIHEFGHYFMAKYHQIKVSLPYYIPLWFGISPGIGTMGAFIRIRSAVQSRKEFFDIGIAGPLAGFVAALVLLWYGFTHLPPIDYVFAIHPEYARFGHSYGQFVYENPEGNVALGDNLLFSFFKNYVADPELVPHKFEIIHYPYLFAGFLSLFFTSLNLLPIGQLDGGHVLYGLIGKKHFDTVASVFFVLFAFYAGLGMFRIQDFATGNDTVFNQQQLYLVLYAYFLFLCFRKISDNSSTPLMLSLIVILAQLSLSYFYPQLEGYAGFLLFIFILGRFLGVKHPETNDEHPLSLPRKILGWIAVIVFILSFSPQPFIVY